MNAAAILLTAALASSDPEGAALQRFETTAIRMGVPVTITVYSDREEAANTAVSAAFARIRDLNNALSDYDTDSELSRLCKTSEPGKPVVAGADLFALLDRSERLARSSDGAFDITIGPVVRLWRKARRERVLPDAESLAQARALVDWKSVRLDRERRTVELLRSGMRLDLGGIAKGYAADEALKVLKSHGLSRALVAAAGDIAAADPPPGKSGWRIGIAPAADPDAAPRRFVSIANAAVSTSGDSFQYVEIAGMRYSHIVDPKTGLGMTRGGSVTVIARDATTTDAVATALSVVEPSQAVKLASEWKVEALLVESENGGKPGKEVLTAGFPRYLVTE